MLIGGNLKFLILLILFHICTTVDRDNFKTCNKSGFCKRQRDMREGQSPYFINPDNLLINWSSVKVKLENKLLSHAPLSLTVFTLTDKTLRVTVEEFSPIGERYKIPVGDVLIEEPKEESFHVVDRDSEKIILEHFDTRIILNFSPFRIDVLNKEQPVLTINNRGLLKFEHLRVKKEKENERDEGEAGESEKAEENEEQEEVDMWDETFKSHTDSKPKGPTSVGLDFSFPGYEHVFGIPEHADSFALKTTKSTDPYRLYNLDVFEYEVNNPMALYGSVPVMLAHNEKQTVGMFWNNAAETWIDISSNVADKNMFSKFVDFVKGDNEIPQVDTHWFSESGIIDVFFFFGPKPNDVFRQYAKLTGTTPLPPLFAIAYHQSRWNYNDEQDVANVDNNFDEHDIPMDVIWLDIEHTDGKRYFTWDQHKFPHPLDMISELSRKGRKLVTIVDPHMKRDDNYFIYKEALDLDLYTKDKNGNNYEGWCWPGSSSWMDFTRADVRKFWASKFAYDQYKGSNNNVFTWNDMNEPSVFSGPEITMPKDLVHHGGWEHRDIHNLYGLYVHQATFEGLLERSKGEQRPFVLSRAFFAGSQRFGAVWTGDNTGDWSHLKISIPMLLSLNIVGITLSGADVGGFFKNPDAELLTRWYQAAAFQPFFRAHAHLDTRRREPWILPQDNMKIIRQAIRLRYMLLPYWYCLFFNSEKNGAPIMKPLWVDFPQDKNTFTMDDQHLIGSAILVKPIVDQGSTGVNVYLPGVNDVWYEMDSYKAFKGDQNVYVPADLSKIPVFFHGGTIIPVRERVRRTSVLSIHDPYTIMVFLDNNSESQGELYHDDFQSHQYRTHNNYIHRLFKFENNRFSSSNLNKKESMMTEGWIEKIIILGLPKPPKKISLDISGKTTTYMESAYSPDHKFLTIRKPGMLISVDFVIQISY